MRSRFQKIMMLCVLGFLMGTGIAWYQVQQEQGASSFASIEPAAGSGMAAGTNIGGPFTLVDHHGTPVTEQDYAGSYKLVFFGFTYCPDICPAELQKMASVLDTLGEDSLKIEPLFITVDPGRDTPDVMKQYVENFHPRITGLTGTKEQIKAAQDAYKVYAAQVKGDEVNGYMMNHSSFTFFLGPNGELIELFSSSDSASDIAATIAQAI